MARRIAGVPAAALALLSVLMAATCAAGRDFYVGGGAGWAPNPAEPFNAWAERSRFQVNDTLVFRYSKGADAVLVVSQGHYDACNATEPVLRLDDDSRFVFHSSGPYFFISPDAARCRAGEHLIVVVLAVRDGSGGGGSSDNNGTPPKPSASPAPPPKSTSSSPPPPSSPHAQLPTPPPPSHPVPGKNASSPSQSPAPGPTGTNGTSSPPPSPSSSAVAFRGGFMACLMLIGGAAILV